jgi:hypothetical protein
MVILFESYGNFVSGKASYFALISKKSRGTIVLTEKNFSFNSIKDQILFQINIADIDKFVLNKRFNLNTIELNTDNDNIYTFYPHKKSTSSIRSSKRLSEDLFRELTRAAFKRNYPVLYETKAGCWEGIPSEENWKSTMKTGILILTENALSFKPFHHSGALQKKIAQIKEIKRSLVDSSPYITIETKKNEISSYLALKEKSLLSGDNEVKTDKFYEIVNQAKNYKETENIQLELRKKELIEKIKSILSVSNKIKIDMMRNALNMNKEAFLDNVFKWAEKFKFIIDGNYIIVDNNSIPYFVENLATGFKYSKSDYVKVKCSNCQKLIDYSALICPYCGKEVRRAEI